jgi:hypothetical protein
MRTLTGHSDKVWSLAFSPDGRIIASAGADGNLKIWDLASGQAIRALPVHFSQGESVAFSPDGRLLASADDDEVVIWDTITWRESFILTGHTGRVTGLAFSPDGRQIVSASWDNTLRLWDLATGQLMHTLTGHTLYIHGVAFRPDGSRIASVDTAQTKVWDTATGQETLTLKGGGRTVAFSPNGWWIAVGAPSYSASTVWDARPLEEEAAKSAEQSEAERLVQSLFDKLLVREDVLESLRTQSGLSKSVRDRALILAEGYPVDANHLNGVIWNVVRRPGREPAAYFRAVRRAESLCRTSPGVGLYLNTLGVARYRAGHYREATGDLEQSLKLNAAGSNNFLPADLAFLALSQHRRTSPKRHSRLLADFAR